jgi:hypothetical protein
VVQVVKHLSSKLEALTLILSIANKQKLPQNVGPHFHVLLGASLHTVESSLSVDCVGAKLPLCWYIVRALIAYCVTIQVFVMKLKEKIKTIEFGKFCIFFLTSYKHFFLHNKKIGIGKLQVSGQIELMN